MTSEKPDYSDLVSTGSLKIEPRVGFDQVERLISRSRVDIEKAIKLLGEDLPTAMDLVYKSMFHASNALIRSQGFRPGHFQQHKGVVEAVNRTLGEDVNGLVKSFDNLRKTRNEFEYQAIFHSSSSEIKSAIERATELLERISKHIDKNNPQIKLDIK